MDKTIILRHKKSDYFLKYIQSDEFFDIYINNCEKKLLFKVFYHFSLPLLSFYFSDWKKKLKECKKVIIFDNMYNSTIARYIKKKQNDCIVILYYWNKINNQNKFILHSEKIDSFYTFNLEDSKKYHIFFNPQFYSKNVPVIDLVCNCDIVFLGLAKSRLHVIQKLEKKFAQMGLKCNFKIILSYEDFISYDEYLNMVYSSKCILDIGEGESSGLTLRALEALFMDKKLITNYKNIIKYDFYDSNNIFILNNDNLLELNDFLKKPLKKVSNNIKNKYEYEAWKKNFKVSELKCLD